MDHGSHTSKRAQKFISNFLRKEEKDSPNKPQAQRVAIAFAKARQAGLKVPAKGKK